MGCSAGSRHAARAYRLVPESGDTYFDSTAPMGSLTAADRQVVPGAATRHPGSASTGPRPPVPFPRSLEPVHGRGFLATDCWSPWSYTRRYARSAGSTRAGACSPRQASFAPPRARERRWATRASAIGRSRPPRVWSSGASTHVFLSHVREAERTRLGAGPPPLAGIAAAERTHVFRWTKRASSPFVRKPLPCTVVSRGSILYWRPRSARYHSSA
jgi:hypothetical protein